MVFGVSSYLQKENHTTNCSSFQFQNSLQSIGCKNFTSGDVFLHELSVIYFVDLICRRRNWFPVVQLRRKQSRRGWLHRRIRSGNVENQLGFLRSCRLLPLYRFHGRILEISVPCCCLTLLKFNTNRYWTYLFIFLRSPVCFCFAVYSDDFRRRCGRLIC